MSYPTSTERTSPLLVQNLVPRFLWPDKPTVNAANQFFQVTYGLTEEGNLPEGFDREWFRSRGLHEFRLARCCCGGGCL